MQRLPNLILAKNHFWKKKYSVQKYIKDTITVSTIASRAKAADFRNNTWPFVI